MGSGSRIDAKEFWLVWVTLRLDVDELYDPISIGSRRGSEQISNDFARQLQRLGKWFSLKDRYIPSIAHETPIFNIPEDSGPFKALILG
jgi:hypothetical protein